MSWLFCLLTCCLFLYILLFRLGFGTVFAWLQCATSQHPSKFPCCLPHGVFISITQQKMGHSYTHLTPAFCARGHNLTIVLKFTSIYCPFFSGHNNIKVDDSSLSVFDLDQWLIPSCYLPSLLVQKLWHAQQVKIMPRIITAVLQYGLQTLYSFFVQKRPRDINQCSSFHCRTCVPKAV